MTTETSRVEHPALPAITIVTPGFAPDAGGVEAHTSAIASELVGRGFDVEVLTARRGIARTTESDYRGCRVVTYPAWRSRTMSISPQLLRAAARRGRTGRLMHVHSYHSTAALALLSCSAPVVFTPHYHGRRGHTRLASILHMGFYHLGRRLFRNSDMVICVSEAERQLLLRDFPSLSGRISVIPNGIAVRAIREAEPFADEPPTVLCVGRLETYKRVNEVVGAFAGVAPPAQLVIIGDGSQRGEIDRRTVELGLQDRVRVLGSVSDAELHRWFATATAFVSLSQREAFGIAPLEAASAGARVILSDIPAHREIVSDYLGDGAVLMDDPPPHELAVEIERQLSKPCRHRARVPDWREIATQTAEVYRNALFDRAAALCPREIVNNEEIIA